VKQIHNEAPAISIGAPARAADAEGAFERLFELTGRLGEQMSQELAGRGLTTARAELLWHLHHHGPVTQRALSQALRCTPRNVTGLLDALQAAGLVARGPHPTDRRATLVTLTDSGAAVATAWHFGYRRAAAHLFDGVAPEDLGTFVSVLDRVLARLDPSSSPTQV
jgi:DNA-binding MarR family transcriptional regulator